MSHGHGHAEEGASQESIAAGYELKDTNPRPLIIMTIGMFVLVLLSFALIGGLMFVVGSSSADADSNRLEPTSVQLPPEPRLEQNPTVDGDRIESEASERLESIGAVPSSDGSTRAHIPIERAEELLLEKGINPFGEPGAQAGGQ